MALSYTGQMDTWIDSPLSHKQPRKKGVNLMLQATMWNVKVSPQISISQLLYVTELWQDSDQGWTGLLDLPESPHEMDHQ